MDGVWLGTGGEVTEGFLISVVVRLLVAAVSGGIVGFERGLKGRPAGASSRIFRAMSTSPEEAEQELNTCTFFSGCSSSSRARACWALL